MKKCIACQIVKPYDDFNKQRKSFDKYSSKCRDCVKQYYKEIQKNGIKLSKEERVNIMRSVRVKIFDEERNHTNELLKGIGYDIDSEVSIHQQFMLKHNLVQ